jgi:oxygen-dependent protoporphyrinogen oxidase
VVVIGGGVAGLVTAWRLQQAGRSVQLLEAKEGVGGWARTRTVDGFQLEDGPNSFRGQAQALHALVEELEIELCTPEDVGVRWISRRGRAFQLPRSPLGLFFCSLLSIRGRLRILLEPFIRRGRDPHETVLSFFSRRLGSEAALVLVGSMVGGIHGTDPARLGMADAFPQIWALEREHRSLLIGLLRSRRTSAGIFAPRAGMGEIARVLAQQLGDAVIRQARVEGLEPIPGGWRVRLADRAIEASQVVLATPVHVAARLLEASLPDAAQLLGQVQCSSLALVHRLGLGGGGELPRGFGILIAPDSPRDTLGILFVSRQHPYRVPSPGAWSLASIHPLDAERSQEEWAELAASETAALLDFGHEASQVHVQVLPQAIPVLAPGHLERMHEVQALLLAADGPVLAGSYLQGISMECAVQSGEDAARQLLREADTEVVL